MNQRQTILYFLTLIQAIIASLGSLFFSEVMHFTPCKLCWFQRILMYPLVFMVTTGILRKDKLLHTYVLPLSISGLFIALYHNLLNWGIIPETQLTCSLEVSCTTKYTGWFGFITIPLMSLTAFSIITLLMYVSSKSKRPVTQKK